ncbi:hypothetical protein AAC387_Pa06g2203 [Persea americana]
MQLHASEHMQLFLIFILLSHVQSSVITEGPIFSVCGPSNYTSGGEYETNLNTILPSLSSNGVIRRDSFYNTTNGDGANKVYGFSQCMSAASEDDCRKCLINSTAEIIRRCPNKTEATIRYYNCILRYSDQSFFSELDTTIRIILYPLQNATNATLFNTKAEGLMNDLTTAAASAASKYAVNFTEYDSFQRIYGLAQCTRDLSESSCNNCLIRMMDSIPSCCDGRTGGNVYSVSCNIRYDTFIFFSLPPPPSPPPQVAHDFPTPAGGPTINPTQGTGNKDTSKTIIIVISIVVILIILSIICVWLLIRKKEKNQGKSETRHERETETTISESLSFKSSMLRASTNNFSTDNKLGDGGFGPVYKGKLSDGREIAVKKLSRRSGKGLEELRNELALVAKLEHRNLVRLLGWCIEEQEKMLVYEYLANTSLNKFLFDPVKRVQLDWERRYKIIVGIARGLLYLHEDSRHCITHQNLKASNILLDGNMNPKIADFGLARLFSVDQTQDNTSRILRTNGYMAPEYVIHGQFSIRSDIFSFGVLVLEIVTGRENIPFSKDEHLTNLLSYVWKHWNGGTSLEIIDQSIAKHHSTNEILRCVHMGLLCVQDDATQRPTMSSVVLMLNSYSMTFPVPSPPAFFVGSNLMG